MNNIFNISEWANLISWEEILKNALVSNSIIAPAISGPASACAIHYLRKILVDCVDWGQAVPTDIFVWAKGEGANRVATKLGGLPYRSKNKEWPKSKHGVDLPFICQFNFDNSRDLVDVPKAILLVFGFVHGDVLTDACFEWMDAGLPESELVSKIPTVLWMPEAMEGYIYRTDNFPNATLMDDLDCAKKFGFEIDSIHRVFAIVASSIGCNPYVECFCEERGEQLICSLTSMDAGVCGVSFPWINVEAPEDEEDLFDRRLAWYKLRSGYPFPPFNFSDLGCLFVTLTKSGDANGYTKYI